MPMDTITRCYRYALNPSKVQCEAIFAAASTARRYWNALVACQRYAEHEIERGRRGSIASELTELLLAKNLTGVAVIKARARRRNQRYLGREGCAAQSHRPGTRKLEMRLHQERLFPAQQIESQARGRLCARKRANRERDGGERLLAPLKITAEANASRSSHTLT